MNSDITNSQNFLVNKKLVTKLIGMANIQTDDCMFEIGPGKGVITAELCTASSNVVAIERDSELVRRLIKKFWEYNSLKIVHADFLSYKLPEHIAYRIFSNIPFNITTEILDKLLFSENPPSDMHLIVQLEAAYKYFGRPYYRESLKSLIVKPIYAANILYYLSPDDFWPRPKVRIVFVRIAKRVNPDVAPDKIDCYRDFVAFVFGAKGKNFRQKTHRIFSHKQQTRLMNDHGISHDSTVTEWTYSQWLSLFRFFFDCVDCSKQAYIFGAFSDLQEKNAKLEKIHKNRSIHIQNKRKRSRPWR